MSTAIVDRPKKMTLRDRLRDPNIIAEIGRAMPAHCKPERMARIALTALNRVPKLANCTEASFFECLLSLSQWGLEPDGRHAHLIPYGDKCTLIIDYKGYVELVYRAGVVKKLHSDVIYEGDIFEWNICEVVKHVPWFLRHDPDRPATRGNIIAVYSQAWRTDGDPIAEVMPREDVEAIRKRSKAGNSGPWVSDWNEMAKKTVFRRLTKWLQLSPEIRDAMDRDDDRLDAIVTVKQQPQSLTDITAGLIAHNDGDYVRTADESQETPADEPTIPIETPATTTQQPPLDWDKAESDFLAAKTIARVSEVLESWIVATTVQEGEMLRALADKARQRIRDGKK